MTSSDVPLFFELLATVLVLFLCAHGYKAIVEAWAYRGRIVVDMETGERLS